MAMRGCNRSLRGCSRTIKIPNSPPLIALDAYLHNRHLILHNPETLAQSTKTRKEDHIVWEHNNKYRARGIAKHVAISNNKHEL